MDGQIGVFIGYNVSLSELERGECCCQILVAVFPCLTQGGGNTVTYRGVVGMATSGSMGWLMYLGPRDGCWGQLSTRWQRKSKVGQDVQYTVTLAADT